ncbi:MAG TPA: hypothetical protein ENI23_10725 [bacterium]|nr:hypothetical protein [bacterium]
MKINKLTIKNFKKFNEKTFEFSDGVNVVQGLNEAGKSTLSEAILALLFADPSTKSKQFFDKYSSWDQGGSIFLQAEGTSHLGAFSITKDFGLKLAKLVNIDSKKESSDIKSVEKSIGTLLGISSQKVYEATAFIKQSELAAIENSSDLTSSIQNAASASGSEGGVQAALKKLDKDITELKKGLDRPTNTPGKIKELQLRTEETKKSLTGLRDRWEKVKKASEEGKSSKGKVAEIKEKLLLLETQLENNKKLKEATEKYKEVEQQILAMEKELGQFNELGVQINSINQSTQSFKGFVGIDIEKTGEELNALKGSIAVKAGTLEKLKALIVREEKRKEEEKPGFSISIFIPIVFGSGAVTLYFILSNLPVLLIGLGIAAVLLVLSLVGPKKYDRKDAEEQKKLREVEYKKIEDEIAAEKKKIAQAVTKLGVKDLDTFFTQKAQYKAYLEEKGKLEATQKGILGETTLEQIKDEQAKLLAKKKEIEINELTEDVRNSELSSDQYLKRRRELDTLKMEERRLSKVETASKVRVEDAEVSIDNVIETEENLERFEEDLKYYEKKRKILELTYSTIEQAMESTAKGAGSLISEYVKEHLPMLTGDRYSDLRVEKDLSISVFSPERNDWVDPMEALSTGTVDQIYFLTRLAFLDLVAKEANPPIILDDPFVTFDAKRKESTKKLLQDIAKKHQVILLTHHDEYGDWGKKVQV